MNPHCTEAVIRKAADWRAFKRGSELAAGVTGATATAAGWRGAVRDGRRPLRVAVTAKSPTDIEARCPCAENQSTGAFCCHAVAVGLALAKGEAAVPGDKRPLSPRVAPPPGDPPPLRPGPADDAWRIELPPPWLRMLAGGRLAVRVSKAGGEAPDEADARLGAWLAEVSAPGGGMLQLDGNRLAAFLTSAAGHPRVVQDGRAVEIRLGDRLRVASVEPDDGGGRVVITPDAGRVVRIGSALAETGEDRISILSAPLLPELRPLAAGKPVAMPMRDFLERAGILGEALEWPVHGWLAGVTFVAARPEVELTIRATKRALEVLPRVRYGESPPVAPGSGVVDGLPSLEGDRCLVRDHDAERGIKRLLESRRFTRSADEAAASWELRDEDRIADFLNETLPDLEARFTVHHGPGLAARIRDAAVIAPKFDVVASGEDWLEFDLSFQSNDSNEKMDPTEVWRMLKTGGSTKSRRVTREATEVIEPLFSELDLAQENGRFVAKGASAECVKILRENDRNANNKSLLNINQFEIPGTLNADLRPYQRDGAAWVSDRLNRYGGALLADDMGLGKTVQAIAVIERMIETHNPDGLPVLVVATTSLLGNWRAEFGKFAPARRVRVLHGARREAEKERAGGLEVWLTSFGTLARDLAWYLRRRFLAVVVDEASLMRNPATDHAKALFKLDAAHRLALTGTPVENGVRDLWSIFRFIQPGWLGGRREFQERYELPAGQGDSWTLRRLAVKTAPFMLRRTKEEVAGDLPGKILIDEVVDLGRDQRAVYRELLEEGRRMVGRLEDGGQQGSARMQVLTTLLRMRQACCDLALLKNDRFKQMDLSRRSSKIEHLLELLDSAISGNHRILIFSQFKTQLREIRELLTAREIDSLLLDGETRNRQEVVDRFQSADGPPVFLISLKAGGYGLNLTAADVVIHFDPWWNPAAEAQATDRAHRIGQTRPVTVYRLLTRGTVEEKVVSLQRRKRAVAAAIDEAGGGDARGWTDGELAGLFG